MYFLMKHTHFGPHVWGAQSCNIYLIFLVSYISYLCYVMNKNKTGKMELELHSTVADSRDVLHKQERLDKVSF